MIVDMGTTIEVELGGLERAADGLGGVATSLRSMHSRLAMVDGLRDPYVAGGLSQLVTAYSVVVRLLGDDLELVGRRIAEGGVQYLVTESAVAAAFPP
jgi:hypothetical protein